MRISREEINVIKRHLVGIGVLAHTYDVTSGHSEYRINDTGMRLYTTILYLLGQNKLFNGPVIKSDLIRYNQTEIMKDFAIREKFIEYIPTREKYSLTHRGMEHLKIMFKLDAKGHVNWAIKLGNLIRKLKG